MKKLLLILLCIPIIGFGQFTYVPDDNFEQALINLGYDTFLDDNVTTASIDTVTYLNIDSQGITDLTGIADFISLATLSCNNNQLSSLVVLNPSLRNLSCTNNQMINLDVSNNGINGSLDSVDCSFNQLTSLIIYNNSNLNYLDCSNNLITTIDFGSTNLFNINCSNNLFTELDVSICDSLIYFNCSDNDLNTLDIRNGNNLNITNANFNSTLNPNLNCIDVDNPLYSIANWNNIDSWSSFSINCPPVVFGCTDSISCNYSPTANVDDGSCLLAGCIDFSACNYDINAFCDDGSCIYINTSVSVSNVSCNGLSDGIVVATANGGVSPYQYSLNIGAGLYQTSGTFSNLDAGVYSLDVVDTNGCYSNQIVIITEPNPLNVSIYILDPLLCYGDSIASVVAVPDGGTLPYIFNWTSGQITDTVSNLSAGSYTVFVVDNNGCNDFATITINSPSAIISNNNLSGCDSVLVGSNYYSISGVYADTLTSVNGCDSIVNSNLTLGQTTASYDTLSVGASIVWNGMPLNVSGDYSVTLFNSFGCDSIVNLNLTITTTGISDLANNKTNLIKITDILGKEIPNRKNTTLFYIYDDGTVEKRIVIE